MSSLLFCARFVEGVYPIHLNKMPAKHGGLSVNSQYTSQNEIVSPGLPGHVEFIFCCSPTVCFSAARAVFPADSEQKRATDADLHAVLQCHARQLNLQNLAYTKPFQTKYSNERTKKYMLSPQVQGPEGFHCCNSICWNKCSASQNIWRVLCHVVPVCTLHT